MPVGRDAWWVTVTAVNPTFFLSVLGDGFEALFVTLTNLAAVISVTPINSSFEMRLRLYINTQLFSVR